MLKGLLEDQEKSALSHNFKISTIWLGIIEKLAKSIGKINVVDFHISELLYTFHLVCVFFC